MRSWGLRFTLTVVLGATALACLAGSAGAVDYAPVDTPGPPLDVSQAQLDANLTCNGNLAGSALTPVLLVPGTTVNPRVNYSWNWEPALTALGIPWCAVELPGQALEDIQMAGEYVAGEIRAMHARAGRRIDILGHSQGGMVPRWALRWWPDTRAMVDDLIGFAPSNHGTIDAQPLCIPGCAPAIWQQRDNSDFVKALNSGQETFHGVSYSAIYTHTDEVVFPNLDSNGTSSLHGGDGEIANVAIQEVCPLDVSEHLLIGTVDPVAYALAIDAMTHSGPANPSRIASGVCSQLAMPGVNPLTLATDFTSFTLAIGSTLATYPHVPAEPKLACYVTGSCPVGSSTPAGATNLTKNKKHRKCRKPSRHHKRCHKKR
jgi:pimeloyl-ACP methyl ester carboxylesterase